MKLFVRNISWDATEDDFRRWLVDSQGYDPTEVVVIRSGEDGRSRGFGFVTFVTEASGNEALRDLNGEEFMGRPLYVEVAVERERRGSATKGARRNGGLRGRIARRGGETHRLVSDGRISGDDIDWGD
jgi:RNA recognition motif-containing protein